MRLDGRRNLAKAGSLLRLGLIRQTGWSALAYLLPQGGNLLLMPLLIPALGIDRYGVWALTTTTLTILAALDGGLGASLMRFFALHRGRGDTMVSARLLLASLVFAAVWSALTLALLVPLAPRALTLTTIPIPLRAEALVALRALPPLAGMVMMTNAFASLLRANDHYRSVAIGMAAAQLAYVMAVLALAVLRSGLTIPILLPALYLQYGVSLLALAVLARSTLRPTWAGWPSGAEVRQLWSYAWRTQIATASAIVNLQVDALVIAVLLPIRYVALYYLGASMAAAARSLPMFSLPPICSRLTSLFGQRGLATALQEFYRLNRLWVGGVVVYGLLLELTLPSALGAWLGRDLGPAIVVAAVLFLGYAINLSVGVMACLARAVGKPELESRVGLITMTVNLVLTYPLARVAGIYGVIAATAVGHIVATAYLPRALKRSLGAPLREGVGYFRFKPVFIVTASVLMGHTLLTFALGAGMLTASLMLLLAFIGMAAWLFVTREEYAESN
jgi:O-antigen/teichoic acid export membrane protein